LARASLLHYESLGLLAPQARSPAGYRLYGEEEVERLRAIRRYRDAGLSLAAIRDLLVPSKRAARRSESAALLESHLFALNDEIDALRAQQQLLARLLATREFRNVDRCRSKEAWTRLLRRAGFSEAEMRKWHVAFESESPVEHAAFLTALGLAPSEVAGIRRWSRASGETPLPRRGDEIKRSSAGQSSTRRRSR
jgi:DNA-binding transcriptional MerR regulator